MLPPAGLTAGATLDAPEDAAELDEVLLEMGDTPGLTLVGPAMYGSSVPLEQEPIMQARRGVAARRDANARVMGAVYVCCSQRL